MYIHQPPYARVNPGGIVALRPPSPVRQLMVVDGGWWWLMVARLTCEAVDGGCLPGSVGAQQAEELILCDAEP